MRVVLAYPPPWAINGNGCDRSPSGFGAPAGWAPDQGFGSDEIAMPYGLMSIAAQAMRKGEQVTLLNLYTFAWEDIRRIIEAARGELFGFSCLTANRRGTQALSELVRRQYPSAFIVVGGPHASALPSEILHRWAAVDAVVIGEGEVTFMEIVAMIKAGKRPQGIPGLAWRENGGVRLGGPRVRIRHLDSLASPHDHFPLSTVFASRGCPHRCTFCASPVLWGREVRFHSPDHVFSMVDRLVTVSGAKAVAFKDDTFTCNRRLVRDLCRRIIKEGLKFLWSCDTRADSLDEDLMRMMRLAGCERISLGVESADPGILRRVRKNITPEQVRCTTRMAKKYGFQVRYYMMAGNRGESCRTLDASIAFLKESLPNQFVFAVLSLYPGTEEFDRAVEAGLATHRMFFDSDRPVFKCFRKKVGGAELLERVEWVLAHARVQRFWRYGVAERKAVLNRLPDLPAAVFDLGIAYLEAGRLREAEDLLNRALAMDYPLAGLVYNALACIAAARNEIERITRNLDLADQNGTHQAVMENRRALRKWRHGGRIEPLKLVLHNGFERCGLREQPADPGPIFASNLVGAPSGSPCVYVPVF